MAGRYRYGSIFLMSVFVSVLIHWLILKWVVIIPPQYHPSYKPEMSFLGSILQDDDISNVVFNIDNFDTVTSVLGIKYSSMAEEDFSVVSVPKPIFYYDMSHPVKHITKFIIPIKKKDFMNDEDKDSSLGIGSGVNGYLPLRLYVR